MNSTDKQEIKVSFNEENDKIEHIKKSDTILNTRNLSSSKKSNLITPQKESESHLNHTILVICILSQLNENIRLKNENNELKKAISKELEQISLVLENFNTLETELIQTKNKHQKVVKSLEDQKKILKSSMEINK